MKTVRTFTATIYVGLKERDLDLSHDISEVHAICQDWVNHVGQCVTVTPTTYIYSNGSERGVAVGFINYPRFPSARRKLRRQALELASLLMDALNQYRVSVVFPRHTVMLSNSRLVK